MEETRHRPFFVYGTLLPGQPNFFLWGADIIAMESAVFHGARLYDMGYYPMLVTAVPSETVQGMIITVNPAHFESVVQQLDELEGYDPYQPEESGYRRRVVEVVLADGGFQRAWVYLGDTAHVQDKPVIVGCSWAAYTANHQSDLQEWWKTIHTVAGLHKKSE
mgnify:CR=1 FL=1